MQSKEHWERVYAKKSPNEVSWFQKHAAPSLKLIREAAVPTTASIIDVGGGASTLVDDLLADGFDNVTVLDLSGAALAASKVRLGARSARVKRIEANILETQLPEHAFDVWHDRAVFHFLTSAKDRRAYVQAVLHAVKPGGIVIVATFAEDGPKKCSGLPVMRYGPKELHAEFGQPFQLLRNERETHVTPGGGEQKFVYCLCRKIAS
jgi:2-polyprenyl-3-methyl-5-hydroxy-6-metoxy-1,4-benzoquinol methylase